MPRSGVMVILSPSPGTRPILPVALELTLQDHCDFVGAELGNAGNRLACALRVQSPAHCLAVGSRNADTDLLGTVRDVTASELSGIEHDCDLQASCREREIYGRPTDCRPW